MKQSIKPEDLPERLIEKIRDVRIDDIRKSLDEKLHGILLGDDKVLKYWTPEKMYTLAKVESIIWGVELYNQKIFCDTGDDVIVSLPDQNTHQRDYYVRGVVSVNETLYDHGLYGIYDTLTDQPAINEEMMEKHDIHGFESIFSGENKTFTLTQNKDLSNSVYELNIQNKKITSIGQKIHQYNTDHEYICHGVWTPIGIITCTNLDHIRINCQRINNTTTQNNEKIHRLGIISINKKQTQLAYAGYEINRVVRATIHYDTLEAQTETLIPNLSDHVGALRPVLKKQEHNTVMNIIEELQ